MRNTFVHLLIATMFLLAAIPASAKNSLFLLQNYVARYAETEMEAASYPNEQTRSAIRKDLEGIFKGIETEISRLSTADEITAAEKGLALIGQRGGEYAKAATMAQKMLSRRARFLGLHGPTDQ